MENPNLFSSSYPLNILILEGGPNAPSEMRNILANLGYRPEVAANSEEMRRLAGKKSYDVILTDAPPGELEKMLGNPRCKEEERRPLIIALMDPVKPGYRNSCLEAGMDHYISKPLDPRELKLQLKACSVLSGNCRIRAAR